MKLIDDANYKLNLKAEANVGDFIKIVENLQKDKDFGDPQRA